MSNNAEAVTHPYSIGVITRNGMPFITQCLGSLNKLEILPVVTVVDSGSTDGTSDFLEGWVADRDTHRLLRIEGAQNASIARNALLSEAPPGHLFLLDGDVVINPEFIAHALPLLGDRTLAACGDLEDCIYSGNEIVERKMRYGRTQRGSIKSTGGIIFVSEAARNLRFDEKLRRNEDLDYSLRLSELGQLLYLPMSMGEHHTVPYYSRSRIRNWLFEKYSRPTGMLIRKHFLKPRNLIEIVKTDRGTFLGGIIQIMLCLALFAGPIFTATIVVIALVDIIKFIFAGRLAHYLPTRIIAPWMILFGFFFPEKAPTGYRTTYMSSRPTKA